MLWVQTCASTTASWAWLSTHTTWGPPVSVTGSQASAHMRATPEHCTPAAYVSKKGGELNSLNPRKRHGTVTVHLGSGPAAAAQQGVQAVLHHNTTPQPAMPCPACAQVHCRKAGAKRKRQAGDTVTRAPQAKVRKPCIAHAWQPELWVWQHRAAL
jgi:hypothetical protein